MSNYRIIDLEQGTPDWLEWRNEGIGASDAPTIMGENPWSRPRQLLNEKVGLSPGPVENAAMARGKAMEPAARAAYCEHAGVTVIPMCLEHRTHFWMKASVDGLQEDGQHVVEIKCGRKSYQEARAGRVSSYYYGQLQHILQVTGLEQIDYWAYVGPGTGVLITVERSDRYIEKLFEAEQTFWEAVLKRREELEA